MAELGLVVSSIAAHEALRKKCDRVMACGLGGIGRIGEIPSMRCEGRIHSVHDPSVKTCSIFLHLPQLTMWSCVTDTRRVASVCDASFGEKITMPEGNFTCVYLTSVVSHSYEPLVQSRVSETESPLALLRGPNSRILDGLTSSSQLVEPQP
jgi:hypothetical protein